MNKNRKQFWIASISLTGAIVGVGIFGVPYVISQVGAIPALIFFLVLGGIQVFQGLFFTEAAIACKENHCLPGLAKIYLGPIHGRVGVVALVLGYWASLTAYVAVGGTFLSIIFEPIFGGSILMYALIWGSLGAIALRYGLKTISKLEVVGTIALILALVGIFAAAAPHVQVVNMPAWDIIDPIIPYGVILFSLVGLTAIPEMEEMVEGRRRDYRKAVVIGTIMAAVITIVFGFVVWGVSGSEVTKDAVTGLKDVLGSKIAIPAAIAGFLAVATSYFATAANLKDTFRNDVRLKPTYSWLLAVIPPIIIFVFGTRDFLTMIGLSGAVFGGILAVLVGMLYLKIRSKKLVRRRPLKIPAGFVYVTMAVLASGVLVEAVSYIKKLF